jgi:hypothetical protein
MVTEHASITTTIETVTPAMAADWLKMNTNNRPLDQKRVQAFADDIRLGRWQTTHQGIALSKDGRLLDGQHRLSAIVVAQRSVQMMVFHGVDPRTFTVMDRGKPRTLRDVTGIDYRILEPCSFLARLNGAYVVQAHHVESIIHSPVGAALLEMATVSGKRMSGRASSPMRAAVALRLLGPNPAEVLRQWSAYCRLEFGEMNISVQSFCRQVIETKSPAGMAFQNDRAARAWAAFNPLKPNLVKIIIKDAHNALDEMRQAFRPPWAAQAE